MNFSPDDLPEHQTPTDPVPVRGQASSPVQAEQGSADSSGQSSGSELALAVADTQPLDPAWNGWDLLRLIFLTLVALFVGVFVVLLAARLILYPHTRLGEIARVPLVVVAGQCLAYLLILAYMYVLVTRERRRPDFFAAIHWNWPSNIAGYVVVGFALSVALQGLAHFLPIPKELPIDSFFQTPAEAWALSILSITLAPLMEELFFRGFLYPVLARAIGVRIAIFLT
ncbi:MAG: type II CAAX endopeptidase family protein, partial [Terriglobales bacterium]